MRGHPCGGSLEERGVRDHVSGLAEQSLEHEKPSSSVPTYVRTEAEKDMQHRVGDTPEVRLPILVSVPQEPVRRLLLKTRDRDLNHEHGISYAKVQALWSVYSNNFSRLNEQRFTQFIDTI